MSPMYTHDEGNEWRVTGNDSMTIKPVLVVDRPAVYVKHLNLDGVHMPVLESEVLTVEAWRLLHGGAVQTFPNCQFTEGVTCYYGDEEDVAELAAHLGRPQPTSQDWGIEEDSDDESVTRTEG